VNVKRCPTAASNWLDLNKQGDWPSGRKN